MRYKVKISKRLALRLLKEKDCEVKLEKGCEKEVTDSNRVYNTRCEDFETDCSVIWCYEIGRYIDYENITHIKHQATRFSDLEIFEEVDWE